MPGSKQTKFKLEEKNVVSRGFFCDCRLQNKSEGKQKAEQEPEPCQELKKLWNLKVTVIPNVFGAFKTFPKKLRKETR